MSLLEQQVLDAASSLARIEPLTPRHIETSKSVKGFSAHSKKHTMKALVKSARAFRERQHFGKLRAALLMGTTLLGDEFLVQTERSGVLLAEHTPDERFSTLLRKLHQETDNSHTSTWGILRERLTTYLAYDRLARSLSDQSADALRRLRFRPRVLVKMALVLTELAFLRDHFAFQIPQELSDLVDEVGAPEEVASVSSLLVCLANEQAPLDSFDFSFPAGEDPEIRELRGLMSYGKARVQQFTWHFGGRSFRVLGGHPHGRNASTFIPRFAVPTWAVHRSNKAPQSWPYPARIGSAARFAVLSQRTKKCAIR